MVKERSLCCCCPEGCGEAASYLQEQHVLVAHLSLHRLHQLPQTDDVLPDVSTQLLYGSDLLLLLSSQSIEAQTFFCQQCVVEPLELQSDLLLCLLGLVLVTAEQIHVCSRSLCLFALCDQ